MIIKIINIINYKKKIFFLKLRKKNYKLYLKLKKLELFYIFILKKYLLKKKMSKIEFKIFSQNGEDGVINFILTRMKLKKVNSLEIGCDPLENNTIYNCLIKNRNKFNVFVEMSIEKCLLLKFLSKTFFCNNLDVVNKKITEKNINKFVLRKFKKEDIDLFSIDVDGLDYYILRRINFFPKIIILEYNKYFQTNPITIINNPKFKWGGGWKRREEIFIGVQA